MDTKEVEAGRDRPVHQRGLLQVAEPIVDVERDPIVAESHLARRLGMYCIGVIEQRWLKKAARINNQPGKHNQRDKQSTPSERSAESSNLGCLGRQNLSFHSK